MRVSRCAAAASPTGPAPITLSLGGDFAYAEPTFTLTLPSLRLQATSPMPNGLVKTPDELRDLLAYLLSENPPAP